MAVVNCLIASKIKKPQIIEKPQQLAQFVNLHHPTANAILSDLTSEWIFGIFKSPS